MSSPRYPEYKESGINWLGPAPSHWTVKRLRHIACLNPGKSQVRRLPPETEVTFLPMEAVGDDGSLDRRQTKPLGEVIDGYTYLYERDVAFAKITPCFENGKATLATNLKNQLAFATTELTVLRPDTRLISARYLYRLVTSRPFRELGEASMYGAGGQKRVPDNFARDFAIPLPPPDEQRQIADFLDRETARIDALIEEQQRLIELLQQKRQASFAVAVTQGLHRNRAASTKNIGWLTEVPAHWPAKRLKHLVTTLGGGTPSKDREEFWDGDVPWVSPKDMKKDYIDATGLQISQEAVKESGLPVITSGSILIVVRGMILAHSIPVAMAGCEVTINQDMKGLQPRPEVTPEYLLYLLRGIRDALFQYIDSSAHGTRKIDWEEMGNMLVPVPPIEEQKVIVNRLESINKKIDELAVETAKGIDLLKERRAALIAAAVTGTIDVRDSGTLGSERVADWPKVAEKETPYG